jgi:hypothetical protein
MQDLEIREGREKNSTTLEKCQGVWMEPSLIRWLPNPP